MNLLNGLVKHIIIKLYLKKNIMLQIEMNSFFSRAANGIRKIGAPIVENLRKIGQPITNSRPVGNTSNSTGARSFNIPSILDNVEKGARTIGQGANRGVELYNNLTGNKFIPDSKLGQKAVGVLSRIGRLA